MLLFVALESELGIRKAIVGAHLRVRPKKGRTHGSAPTKGKKWAGGLGRKARPPALIFLVGAGSPHLEKALCDFYNSGAVEGTRQTTMSKFFPVLRI